ncbi:MAG: MATE family efflux transporter, partial [Proteobacteria bacterium]|nr:MATE family efflux transporter [Pseudomonadota bacterium]
GSAWGFVISRSLTMIYTVVVMFTPLELIELKIPVISEVLRSWVEVLRIAVPSTLSGLIGPVSMAIILFLLSPYGPAVIAGFGVASRIEMLATMIMMALASSTAPFIGQNWGARQFDRIHTAQKLGFQFCFGWGLLAAVVLAVFGRQIVGLINNDPAVIEATYIYLLIIPVTFGLFGVSMIAGSTFVALGKPMPTLIMSLGRMLVLYVPMAFLGDRLWGYPGIFAATAAANVLMGIVSVLWVRGMLRNEIGRALLVAQSD